MIARSKSLISFIVIDALILIVGIIGIYQVSQKSSLPFSVIKVDNSIVVVGIHDSTNHRAINDIIIGIQGYKVKDLEEIECILDGVLIGNNVKVILDSLGNLVEKSFITTQYYSTQYIIIASIASFIFFIIGIFVLIKRPEDSSAKYFHAGSLATSLIIATTWGNYNIEPIGIGYFIRIIFSAAYSFAPLFFIEFVFSLRHRKRKSYKYIRGLLYAVAIIYFTIQAVAFVNFVFEKSIESIHSYLNVFALFRIYLIISLVFGLVVFIYTYKTTFEEYERKKLRWIVFGFSTGVLSLIVLWLIPFLVTSKGLVQEEVILLLILFIPITFAISIVRYRLFNIDLIIERTIVYGTAILLILLTYAIVIVLITTFLNITNNTVPAIITAVLVALFFQPLNFKLQQFVNKKFFKIKYDFRAEIKRIFDELKQINDRKSLASIIVKRMDNLIPTKRIAFFLLKKPENRLELLAHTGFDLLEGRSVKFYERELKTELLLPVALQENIEQGADIEIADSKIFNRWEICIAIPVKSETGIIYGFLVLGKKKSNTRFTIEDIDLLTTVSSSAAATFERINLQENLIREHFETERLQELNELKSLFVSTVSHDLKTPIASIRMFAELLKTDKKIGDDKKEKYLQIIEGESDRLTRLINNVLDYAKIEKGIKEYNFDYVNINNVIRKVLEFLEYQIKIMKFDLIIDLTEERTIIYGDEDALISMIINLISNSLKYSEIKKEITIKTYVSSNSVEVSVADKGIGIKKNELDKILNPYFRSENSKKNKRVGSGLGLNIIKHIVNAHKGKINVESELGEGSIFTIVFPKGEHDEKDINY